MSVYGAERCRPWGDEYEGRMAEGACLWLSFLAVLSGAGVAWAGSTIRPTVAFGYLKADGHGYAETVEEACRSAYQVDYQVRSSNFRHEQDTSSSCSPHPQTGVRGPSLFISHGRASHAGARADESGRIMCRISRRSGWERRAVESCGGNRSHEEDTSFEITGYVWLVNICPKGFWLEGEWCVDRRPDLRSQDGPRCGNPVAVSSGCKQESVSLVSMAVDAPVTEVSVHYANLLSRPDLGGRSLGHFSWFLDPVDRRLVFNDPDKPTEISAARGLGAFERFRRREG